MDNSLQQEKKSLQEKTIKNPILIIEDSPEDFEAIKRAFKKLGLSNDILHIDNGDDALAYLKENAQKNLPTLILLDLNLPGTDGRTILTKIKNIDGLKKVPVIVLTTSSDERDINECYNNGANSYIQKPVDLNGFFSGISKLKEYWIEINILPKV